MTVLQMKTKARVRHSEEHGSSSLIFTFHIGPLEVFCLAHAPRPGDVDALVYVKVRLVGRSLLETKTKLSEVWKACGKGAELVEDAQGAAAGEGFYLGPLRFELDDDGKLNLALHARTLVDTEADTSERWQVTP